MLNLNQTMIYLKKNAEAFFKPGTSLIFEGITGEATWVAKTDAEEEGVWKDWYTGEEAELFENVKLSRHLFAKLYFLFPFFSDVKFLP